MKKNIQIRFLAEAGLMIALAFVLSKIKLFRMPQGGSITLGSMVPLIFISMRWGISKGFLTGVAYGFIKIIFGGTYLSPIQVILDYLLTYGILSLSGLINIKSDKDFSSTDIIIFTLLGVLGRYACSVISGVVFFGNYAPENTSALVYSLSYNSFIFVEFLITAVILLLINKTFKRALKL